MVWIQNVQICLQEKVKSGQEVKRLMNQAVYGHFNVPYDLKCLADMEYKVWSFLLSYQTISIRCCLRSRKKPEI